MKVIDGMRYLTSKDFGLPEQLSIEVCSRDGETWTYKWEDPYVVHMNCKGGDLMLVAARLLNDLATTTVNGAPCVIFATPNICTQEDYGRFEADGLDMTNFAVKT